MYCPKCGENNLDNSKFCRVCGEDLSVIAQVMARRFPASLLAKMDAYLERKNERLRRDSIVGVVLGSIFLFLCLYHVIIEREGLSLNVGLTFVSAFFCYLWAAWDFLVYKRSLSGKPAELSGGTDVLGLNARDDSATRRLPPTSVTEHTTRHFDHVKRGGDTS